MEDRSSIESGWVRWAGPRWAPHVHGEHETQLDEDGEQRFKVFCDKCKAVWMGVCTTGAVRRRMATFATSHTHRDPFKSQPR